MKTEKSKILLIAEAAVMIALSIVLNLIVLWQMPLGGKVTLASMLPVMLFAIKADKKWGFGCAFIYSVIQMAFSFFKVLSWGLTPVVLISCFLLDYILPYTALGLAGVFPKKWGVKGAFAGIALAISTRFISHFLSGTVLFGTWEDGVWEVISYSIVYNGSYLLPELALSLIIAYLLLSVPVIQRMLFSEN